MARRVALYFFFYSFANPFNIWLKRSKLDFHICFSIQSVATGCLVGIHEEKMASQRYISRKGRDTLILLSDDWENSPLLLYQNLTSGSFLGLGASCHLKTYQWTFHTLLHENPYIHLVLWMDILPMCNCNSVHY